MGKYYTCQIRDLCAKENQEVTLAGWLYNSRSSGKVLFLILRDGTGLCQCIVEKANVDDELFESLKRLGQESSLSLTGSVRKEDRSVGGYELSVTSGHIFCETGD